MTRTYKFEWPVGLRNEIRINLELQPSEYDAIGRISAQWAFLEYHITLFCFEVCDQILRETPPKNFESESFRKRRRGWEEIVGRAFPEATPERVKMNEIIRECGSIQGERQIAIHSFFQWNRTEPTSLKAHSHKNPHGESRSIDADKLNKIAEKIARLNARLIMWPNDFPALAPGGCWRDINGTQVVSTSRPEWGPLLLSAVGGRKEQL